MTRKEKLIVALIGLLIIVVAVMGAFAPKPTDWSTSYSRYHDKPFGAQLVYDRLGDLFAEVTPVNRSIYETVEERFATWWDDPDRVAHLFVNERFQPEGVDLDQLLNLVLAGDHVFVAAEQFGQRLCDTLGISTVRDWQYWQDTVKLKFERGIDDDTLFSFPRMGQPMTFSDMDTVRSTVLCRTEQGDATLLHVRIGEGHLFLCSTPLAFTNYHLLRDSNNDFIEAALGWLPSGRLYWDEYQKSGRAGSLSPLRYILGQPALLWAYRIMLLLIVLYMFVHAKREQRALPILEALRNSSRDFVGTLGKLYYEKGDHADLARKMIAHFKEDVRNRAYLRAFEYDELTATHLAKRTGIDPVEVTELLRYIQTIELQTTTTEVQLFQLSDRLHALRKRL